MGSARFFRIGDKEKRMIAAVHQREPELAGMKTERLARFATWLASRIERGETAYRVLPDAFTVFRESCKRVWDLRPTDDQIMAAQLLHRGLFVQMPPGSGKTMALGLAAFLHSLSGRGVHILCRNETAAAAAYALLKPILETLGKSTGLLTSALEPDQKRSAYAADVTLASLGQVACDHLLDHHGPDSKPLIQRPLDLALVDDFDIFCQDSADCWLLSQETAPGVKHVVGVVQSVSFLHRYPLRAGVGGKVKPLAQLMTGLAGASMGRVGKRGPKRGRFSNDQVYLTRLERDHALIAMARSALDAGRVVLVETYDYDEFVRLVTISRSLGFNAREHSTGSVTKVDEICDLGCPATIHFFMGLAELSGSELWMSAAGADRDQVIENGGYLLLSTHYPLGFGDAERLQTMVGRGSDPGSVVFLVSLDDPWLLNWSRMNWLPQLAKWVPLDHPVWCGELRRALAQIEKKFRQESLIRLQNGLVLMALNDWLRTQRQALSSGQSIDLWARGVADLAEPQQRLWLAVRDRWLEYQGNVMADLVDETCVQIKVLWSKYGAGSTSAFRDGVSQLKLDWEARLGSALQKRLAQAPGEQASVHQIEGRVTLDPLFWVDSGKLLAMASNKPPFLLRLLLRLPMEMSGTLYQTWAALIK